MNLVGWYEIPTSDWSRKVGFTFDLETDEFSYDRKTRELEIIITQNLIVEIKVNNYSKVEYSLAKLAASVLRLLSESDPNYAHLYLFDKVEMMKPQFEKPDIIDGKARDITNMRALNEVNS